MTKTSTAQVRQPGKGVSPNMPSSSIPWRSASLYLDRAVIAGKPCHEPQTRCPVRRRLPVRHSSEVHWARRPPGEPAVAGFQSVLMQSQRQWWGHRQLNGVQAVFRCFQLFHDGSKLLKMHGQLRTKTPVRASKSVKLTVPTRGVRPF